MAYLALGLMLLIGVLLLGRAFLHADPAVLARGLRWIAGGVALIAIVFLVLSEQLAPALGIAGSALAVALRGRALWSHFRAAAGPRPGRVSEVETEWLRMSLDHDSGTMNGTVRRGRFQGRRLAELAEADLVALWRACRAEDEASAKLLETWLDRVAPDWRAAATAGTGAGGYRARPGGDAMTREEALQILGLAAGADADEIKAAYHRLMLKLHPDQGGSTYLAARVNQARDLLLKG